MTKFSNVVFSVLASLCSIVVCSSSVAQTPLAWSNATPFDTGSRSSVAVLPSGLVVEIHQGERSSTYWYHCGQLQQDHGNWSITWGKSQQIKNTPLGDPPSVAVTRDGYVVWVYSDFDELYYSVGQLSPTGGSEQTVNWLVEHYHYDTGYRPNITINGDGRLIEVHEGPMGTSNRLYLRTGGLTNPSAGDFHIQWSSGKNGLKYDTGVLPHIAVNDSLQVVEVHQVPNEELLHYHRGELLPTNVGLLPSNRYDDHGAEPAVALTGNGTAIEVDTFGARVFSRTGTLPPDSSGRVNWSRKVEIGWPGFSASHPSVATNGQVAVATWDSQGSLYWAVAPLQ